MGFLDEVMASDNGTREYKPVYVREGDCVVYYADDTPCHAIRLDEVATVYVSDDDPNRLIGCQIKGVVKRLRRYGPFSVEISRGGKTKLGLLFLLAGVVPDHSRIARQFFESDLAMQGVDLPELCETH